MLRIRLQRRGKKNYATYRVVVAEASAPIKGRFIADLGSYNPHTDAFVVDNDEVKRWIGQGAKPSDTIHNLLIEHKVISGDKVTIWRPKKKEEEPTEAAAEEQEQASSEEKPAEESKETAPEAPTEK